MRARGSVAPYVALMHVKHAKKYIALHFPTPVLPKSIRGGNISVAPLSLSPEWVVRLGEFGNLQVAHLKVADVVHRDLELHRDRANLRKA